MPDYEKMYHIVCATSEHAGQVSLRRKRQSSNGPQLLLFPARPAALGSRGGPSADSLLVRGGLI